MKLIIIPTGVKNTVYFKKVEDSDPRPELHRADVLKIAQELHRDQGRDPRRSWKGELIEAGINPENVWANEYETFADDVAIKYGLHGKFADEVAAKQ